jgi:hypothetical protein
MEKRVKSYSNTKLLDLGLDRLYYTAHGQHLNSSGKEVIMNKLAVLIRDIFVKNQLKPIHLPWIESMDGSDQDQRTPEKLELNVETSNHLPKSDIRNIESTNQKMEQTTSLNLHKRQRKQIALKTQIFYGTR